ncbi:MAG: Uma2 family endonuclease [Fimbriimonadales bacterium]|nr:Uma2 family endonuclease [Fimbriimonadales bacterium]
MAAAATGTAKPKTEIVYPDSDGKPMADNTIQADAMTIIYNNLRAIFANDPNVFVAMDLLWYPVEGKPRIRVAPDVMVVLGRPKGHRGSYKQWEEAGVAPQVVFEVLSPSNRKAAMSAKRRFYARYGVQEYYVYDPDTGRWQGWLRRGKRLTRIRNMLDWRSPLLGIVFRHGRVEYPGLLRSNLRPFLTFEELERVAEAEHLRAEQERQRAEQERQRAEQERQRAERLAQQLRALGIEPEE